MKRRGMPSLRAAAATLLIVGASCAWAQETDTAPAFEVASIRASQPGVRGLAGGRETIQTGPAGVTLRRVNLRACVAWANHVNEFQVNGPDWIGEARYDIVAKSDGPVPEEQLRLMLKTLLAERFKLTSHRQTKETSAWVLTVGKNGPKFKESNEEGEGSIDPNLAKMEIAVKRTPMSQLVDLLGKMLRAPVIDQTGLTGKYDITVSIDKYLPEKSTPIDIISTITNGIQQELGLKLDNRKLALDLVIIDSAEKAPVEN